MTRPATATTEPPRLERGRLASLRELPTGPLPVPGRDAQRRGSTCIRRREIERAKAAREQGDR